MQYKSPIKLLSAFLQKNEKLEEFSLSLLKKRILAEFELSGKATIETEIGELTKNEIVKLLDNTSSNSFKHHLTIHHFHELLFFLEYNQPDGKLDFSDAAFNNNDFISFLSPYLANSLGIFFTDYVRNPDLPIKLILNPQYPILTGDENLVKEPVFAEIERQIKNIDFITELVLKNKPLPSVRVYYIDKIIEMLNHLPSEYFKIIRQLYLESGIKLLRAFLRKDRTDRVTVNSVRFIYKQLDKLNVAVDKKEALYYLEKYIFPEKESETKKPAKESKFAAIIAISIFAFVFILGISFPSKKRNNNNYQNLVSPYNYYNDSVLIDALQKLKSNNNELLSDSTMVRIDSIIKKSELRIEKLKEKLIDTVTKTKLLTDRSLYEHQSDSLKIDSL